MWDLAEAVNYGNIKTSNTYFKVTTNIDLGSNSKKQWIPIGNEDHPFEGNFDGGEHEITGMFIRSTLQETNYKALFGTIKDAELSNFVVSGSVTNYAYAGGVVGHALGEDVTITGVGNAADVTITANESVASALSPAAGGIVARSELSNSLRLEGCWNEGTIFAEGPLQGISAGMVGLGWPTSIVRILNCVNYGTVATSSSDNYRPLGRSSGILGQYTIANSSQVQNCISVGSATSGISHSFGYQVSAFSNNYYLTSTHLAPCAHNNENIAVAISEEDALDEAMVSRLGSAYMYNAGGFPILASMVPYYGAPTFSEQPQSAQYKFGDSIDQLHVTALRPQVGNGILGTITYQWYEADSETTLGGTPVEDEIYADFEVPAVNPGIYYYYCVATNTYKADGITLSKTATSNVAAITISDSAYAKEPTIMAQPIGYTVGLQEDMEELAIAAEVKGSGAGRLTYQWYSNSTESTEGAQPVDGATSRSFTPEKTLGTTYYYCVVTNNYPGATTQASVTSDIVAVTVGSFEISSVEDLCKFASLVNDGNKFEGQTVVLTTDLDLSSVANWVPIGEDDANPFRGTFDGQYHTITGLTISATSEAPIENRYVGLFGAATNTTIKNVVVKGSMNISDGKTHWIGGIVGYGCVNFENVGAEFDITASGLSNSFPANYVGILGGNINSGNPSTAKNCYATGKITTDSTVGYVGGLIGVLNGSINNCYSWTNIEAEGNYAFGLAFVPSNTNAALTNSYYGGTLTYKGTGSSGAIAMYTNNVANTYYLEQEGLSSGISNVEDQEGVCEAKEQSWLDTFGAKALGEAFVSSESVTGATGLPLLKWQGNVVGNPLITKQPQDASYDQNAQASPLTVEASVLTPDVAGKLSYQWYVSSSAEEQGNAINGATQASFVPSTKETGVFYYTCQVTNTFGEPEKALSTTSDVARVVIKTSIEPLIPVITTQPKGAVVKAGESTSLFVEATLEGSQGAGELSYQWYSASDASKSDAVAIDGATKASFTPTGLNSGDNFFFCEVTNTIEIVKTAVATSDVANVVLDNVIYVENAQQLEEVFDKLNAGETYAGLTIRLTNDIDMAEIVGDGWSHTGNFMGTFDGANHTLSNFYSTTGGLFKTIGEGAIVENFVIEGEINVSKSINTRNAIGSIVNSTQGAASNYPIIRNVGSSVAISVSGTYAFRVGGIVGEVWYSGGYPSNYSYRLSLQNCYNKGNLIVDGGTFLSYYGGLVGFGGDSNWFQANNCYNLGNANFTLSHFYYYGGLSGYYGSFTNCYSAGISTGATSTMAPLPALAPPQSGPSFTKCYYSNAITGVAHQGSTYTDAFMKTEGFANILGDAYVCINSNYPQLKWEEAGPVFTTQPHGAFYETGDTAEELNVEVTLPEKPSKGYDGIVTYQWYVQTGQTPDPQNDTAIEGATSANYTPSTTEEKTTNYYCVATSTYGDPEVSASATSEVATVVVVSSKDASIVFNSHPENSSFKQGSDGILLSVDADQLGAAPQGVLSYAWYINEENSNEGGTLITAANFDRDTVTLNSGELGTHYYYCVVTSSIDGYEIASAASNCAEVTIEPYTISTIDELIAFRDAVNNDRKTFNGFTVLLEKSIDLSSTFGPDKQNWEPIGTSYAQFQGTFDGQGNRIDGLYIDDPNSNNSAPSYYGFFGLVANATIKNLVVSGSITSARMYARAAGIVASVSGRATIENVGNEVDITLTSIISNRERIAAGISAYGLSSSSTTKFLNCYNAGDILIENYATQGGACGIANDEYAQYINCYNMGTIKGRYSTGITNYATSLSAKIENCFNMGNILDYPNYSYTANGFYPGAIAYGNDATRHTNNYALDSTQVPRVGVNNGIAVTARELASSDMVEKLNAGGSAWIMGATGHPLLYWQVEKGSARITQQPESGSYLQGKRGSISVTAELPSEGAQAQGILSYQWYEGVGASAEEATYAPIPDAIYETYALPTTTMEPGDHYFYCLVTNTYEDDGQTVRANIESARALVNIISTIEGKAPVITVQPEPGFYNLKDGKQVPRILSITAEGEGVGYGTLSYQWYSASSSSAEGHALEGETGTTYQPPELLNVGTTYYYCVVTNTFEGSKLITAKSDVVKIVGYKSTSQPPLIITDPEGGVAYPQNTASSNVAPLTVEAQRPDTTPGNTGTLSYQWYRTDDPYNFENATAISGATTSSYAPDTTLAPGDYYYFCRVENTYYYGGAAERATEDTEMALIGITDNSTPGTPSATIVGSDMTVALNTTAEELKVEANIEGEGTLQYQWFVSDDPTPSDDDVAVKGVTKANFTPPTNEMGTYYYYCCVYAVTDSLLKANSCYTDVIKVEIGASFYIYNAVDFASFRTNVASGNTYKGETVVLMADITSSAASVGTTSRKFSGIFEGNGHTISGRTQALFGYTDGATIQNVVVKGTITTNPAGILFNGTNTRIINCGNEANITTTVNGQYAAGIASTLNGGEIIGCYNKGNITNSSTTSRANMYAAGIVGNLSKGSWPGVAQVSGWYNSGNITAGPGNNATTAFTAGCCVTGNNIRISNGYNVGTLLSNGSLVTNKQSMPIVCTATSVERLSDTLLYTVGSDAEATSVSDAVLRGEDAITSLNGGGTSFIFNNAGYPKLWWEDREVVNAPTVSGPSDIRTALNATPESPFTVTVTGAEKGTVSYQWFSNTTKATLGASRIEGATEASYMPPTDTMGTTYYFCKITYTQGTTAIPINSDIACLRILSGNVAIEPDVKLSSTEQNLDLLSSFELTATAENMVEGNPGVGELSYQWYRNTSESTSGGQIISGKTDPTITINGSVSGTYYYYCKVLNTYDEVLTAEAYSDICKVEVGNTLFIATPEKFSEFVDAAGSSSFEDCTVELTADIDLSGIYGQDKQSYRPIGSTISFKGTFNGNFHTISGIYATGTATPGGLFGLVENACIKNFVIKDSTFNMGTSSYYQGLVGRVRGTTTIENVGNEASIYGYYYVGGLVGCINSGANLTLRACYNKGNVYYTQTASRYVGGLVGYNQGVLDMTACYVTTSPKPSPGSSFSLRFKQYSGVLVGEPYFRTAFNARAVYSADNNDAPALSYLWGTNIHNSSGADYPSVYYRNDLDTNLFAHNKTTGLPTADMQKNSFADTLNAEGLYFKWVSGENGNYPMLLWENAAVHTDYTLELESAVVNFTGDACEPTVVVKDASNNVVDPAGYNVSYVDNVASGTATVRVNGNGQPDYFSLEKTFIIKGTDIATLSFSPDPIEIQRYTGLSITPKVTVSNTTTTPATVLEEGVDYTVEYADNTAAGKASMTFVGQGAYEGSKTLEFIIEDTGNHDVYISTAEELAEIATLVGNGVDTEGVNFVLTNDIDLSSVCSEESAKSWVPIGVDATKPFSGNFDGQGHKITGLFIKSGSFYSGLFGYVEGGTLKDFEIEGTIKNASSFTGGAVGTLNGGLIENVGSKVNIEAAANTIGGVVGGIDGSASTVRGCYFKGSIVSTNGSNVGGIVGAATLRSTSAKHVIEGCYNTGAIEGFARVGGILGHLYYSVIVRNCYNTGKVSLESTSSQTNVHPIVGNREIGGTSYSYEVTNNYALSVDGFTPEDGENFLALEDMKNASFIDKLNVLGSPEFKTKEDDTPILYWESLKHIANCNIASITDQPYNAQGAVPSLDISDGSYNLVSGTDYTLTYSNNGAVGEGLVTITGKGNYYGSTTRLFTITGTGIEGALSTIADQQYTGANITPETEVVVTVDGEQITLQAGRDYKVVYDNNKDVGTATVTVTAVASAGYSGSDSTSFNILATPISSPDISVEVLPVFPYTAEEIKPLPELSMGERTLLNNIDYRIEYVDNTNVGDTAKVIITGMGGFTGTRELTFTIAKQNLEKAKVTLPNGGNFFYTGQAIEPEPKVELDGKELVKGVDYSVSYANNTNVSTTEPRITITAIEDSIYTGSTSASFIINETDIGNEGAATISAIPDQVYTGSQIKPETPTVSIGEYTVDPSNLSIEYGENKNVGEGTLTISVSGVDGVMGSTTTSFNIVPFDISEEASVESMAPEAYTYNAQAQTPESVVVKIKGTSPLAGTELSATTDYALSATNNINVGDATLIIKGTGNYTGNVSVPFTIGQASLSDATASAAEQVYTGESLESTPILTFNGVAVPERIYTVDYADNIEVGTATFTATALAGGNFIPGTQISGTYNIVPTNQLAPGGLARKNETVAGKSDGGIFNLSDAMEYSADNGDTWTSVPEGENRVEGLPAGTYLVRYKGDDNHNPGANAKVVIKAVEQPGNPTPLEQAIANASDIADTTAVSKDGKDVPNGENYTDQAAHDALAQAIKDAEAAAAVPFATQKELDAAQEQLEEALDGFKDAMKQAKTNLDELNKSLAAAEKDKSGIKQSANGSNLAPSETYVTPKTAKALEDAITAAKKVASDPKATQAQIDAAKKTLDNARSAFAAEKKTVPAPNKNALKAAIDAAKKAETGVKSAANGSTVAKTDTWTTPAVKKALDDAIAAANKVYSNAKASQADVDKATAAIKKATDTYNKAKKPGTKATIWKRIWGQNALKTMQAITKEFGTASTAVVTTNADFKDALAASALAGANNAPVLMTAKASLSAETKSELKRMGVKKVLLVGSTGSVSANTANQIKALGINVTRISASSASGNAVAAARAVGSSRSDTVIIATQKSYKDALSVAPYAYASKSPILYTETKSLTLSAATVNYIKSAGFKKAIIVGGPLAIPASVENQLAGAGVAKANQTRLAGANAYETSNVIAKWGMGQLKNGAKPNQYALIRFQPSTIMSANKLGVATGQNWKDALAGAALCGKNKSVLLLEDSKNYKTNVAISSANKAKIVNAYVFGGELAVQKVVWNACVASTK